MPNLDEFWASLLDEASSKAVRGGRTDIAEFLRLKIANDTIRKAAVEWLFETLVEMAFELQQIYRNITIERTSPHSFNHGSSNMAGALVEVKHGVRCLSVEAGWVRTPTDGIMRNGALAQARFRHFGMASENIEYRLVTGKPLPAWIDDAGNKMSIEDIRGHLALLVDR